MAQIRGTVKWYDSAKGYGFLQYEGGPDVLVHHAAIHAEGSENLLNNAAVDFDIVAGADGPEAGQVHVVGKPEHSSVGQPVRLIASHGR